jgi:hypothetical protein
MTTDRQIAVNRPSAQHSASPRIPDGKASASRDDTRRVESWWSKPNRAVAPFETARPTIVALYTPAPRLHTI